MQNLTSRFIKRYLHDFNIAVDSLLDNKLKSILTALGIIFGVAAVISMLAIGRGAKEEILEQIKLVGVNNIVISPVVQAENDENTEQSNGELEKRKYSPGLSVSDIQAIEEQVWTVKNISPEISMNSFVVQNGIRESAKIIGVSSKYFDIYNLGLENGDIFTSYHEENGLPVCIIGANIRAKFFSKIDPIDKYIKFGSVWLKVIGVIEKSNISLTGFENAGVNVFNDNIYIPVKTMLLRFRNRALYTSGKLQGDVMDPWGRSITPSENVSTNYHQLDKIIVQVISSEMMTPTAEILSRLMFRKHLEVKDYEIRLPEMELKQEQRTKDIFNVVLGAIAGIALVVGGIGIMNIMFASVMERIKEIGTRLAIGAKKSDIVVQFLSEAVLISVIGGILGVILGIILAKIINHIFEILTIVTPFSVFVAFGVSATIGIIFGYAPAKRASEKDPIESLRHE
ncbi:MAG: ABC transporter permease [Bacteroidales bacterium]|nr:ABC transporter permease [Bacteroidales bacterium]